MLDVAKIGELIKDARKRGGYTQKAAAKRAGLPKRTFETYERAEIQSPSLDKLRSIADALDAPELLDKDLDSVMNPDPSPATVREQEQIVRNAPEDIRRVFERTRKLTVYTDVKPECGDGRIIFAEGTGVEIDIPIELFERLMDVRLPRVMGAMFCTGQSMEPVFEEEDLLFYRPTPEIDGDGNYAIVLDGRLKAKRVQHLSGGGYKLISENKRAGYEDERLYPDEDGRLINPVSDLQVEFQPVGRIFWPKRDTSRLHMQQVKELIGTIVNSNGR